MKISDRVTVLRDGRYIGTVKTGATSIDAIVRMMVGRRSSSTRNARAGRRTNRSYLEVEGLTREPFFRNVSFKARSGEIATFSGLVGAGRTELAESIFGYAPPDQGTIRSRGHPIKSVRRKGR